MQGSGKTLAFGLPVINYLLQERLTLADLEAGVEDVAVGSADDGSVDSDAAAAEPVEGEDVPVEGEGAEEAPAEVTGPAARLALLQEGRKRLRALILCPTRELAMQVCAHLQVIGKAVDVRVAPIVGGISPQKQERLLSYKPAIVVATPGRLWDMMSSGHKHLSDLTHLSFLVLDEADKMVKQGYFPVRHAFPELRGSSICRIHSRLTPVC